MQTTSRYQIVYLARIVGGLGLMTIAIIGASPFSMESVLMSLAIALPLLCIYPATRWLHTRADELEKGLNLQACLLATSITVRAAAIVGTLQLVGLIPAFNMLWGAAFIASTWAIGLMLADRKCR